MAAGLSGQGLASCGESTPDLRDALSVVGLADLDLNVARALADEFNLGPVVTGALTRVRCWRSTRADIVLDIVIPAARHSVVPHRPSIWLSRAE